MPPTHNRPRHALLSILPGPAIIAAVSVLACGGKTIEIPASSETGAADSTTADDTSPAAGDTSTSGPAQAPQPNGAACALDAECMSGFCTSLPADPEQVCSECRYAEDCVALGSGTNCIPPKDVGYYTCTGSLLGEACENPTGCVEGLYCETVDAVSAGVDIPAVCSECVGDEQCPDGEICVVQDTLIGGQLAFFRKCDLPGALPDGSVCEVSAGDEACAGFCVAVPVELADPDAVIPPGSEFSIAFCAECRPGELDCPEGQECYAAPFFLDGGQQQVGPAECVDSVTSGDTSATGDDDTTTGGSTSP